MGHTDKTRWYTTSPAPVFLKALPETTLERIQDEPAYLGYHPVTPIASLHLLPPRSSVCAAGRVVEKTEVRRVNTSDGETDVATLTLRSGDDAVRVHFWRETTRLLELAREGDPALDVCGPQDVLNNSFGLVSPPWQWPRSLCKKATRSSGVDCNSSPHIAVSHAALRTRST